MTARDELAAIIYHGIEVAGDSPTEVADTILAHLEAEAAATAKKLSAIHRNLCCKVRAPQPSNCDSCCCGAEREVNGL